MPTYGPENTRPSTFVDGTSPRQVPSSSATPRKEEGADSYSGSGIENTVTIPCATRKAQMPMQLVDHPRSTTLVADRSCKMDELEGVAREGKGAAGQLRFAGATERATGRSQRSAGLRGTTGLNRDPCL